MNTFVIADPAKCIGCRTCEVACVMAHLSEGEGALSPASFAPRLTVVKTVNVTAPVQCHQCDDAPCAAVCPTGAISGMDDTVQVNAERCIGCKNCMIACPYGAMDMITLERMVPVGMGASQHMVRERKVQAQKCDLCITRIEGPACVQVCPVNALHKVDGKLAMQEMKKRKVLAAESVASAGI